MNNHMCIGLLTMLLCPVVVAAELALRPGLDAGLPANTKVTNLGDEVTLNGIPTQIIGIAVPASIKATVGFFADKWAREGWHVKVDRNGDLLVVMSTNGTLQRVATLTKTGEATTEGTLSVTDLPRRLANDEGPPTPIAGHLVKPVNTLVLNEVRIRDEQGESIMTTLANGFDVEQNAAFYQERMVELGWKEKRHKTVIEGKGVILVFQRPGKEATFTVVRQSRQTFVTVNWINR